MSEASPTCPACERPKFPDATECVHCGVVFARYRARVGPEGPKAPEPLILPASALTPADAASGPVFSRLSLRQLEIFLTAASESFSAGITPHGFAQGAGGAMLPKVLGERFLELAQAGESFVKLLQEIGLPGAGDGAVLIAAEKRGELPKALAALAHSIEARRKALTRFIGQLLYPSLLFMAWILIEPLAVLVLKGPVAYLSQVLPRLLPLLAFAIGAPMLAARLNPRSRARRWLVAPFAAVPPFSGVVLRRSRAAFADVLGSGLRAGLPLYESLSLAGDCASHPSFSRQTVRVREAILRGDRLYIAIQALPFSKEERAWIQHGEESGHLDAALLRLSERNREQAQLRTRILFLLGAVLFAVFVLARLILGTVEAYRGYFRLLDGIIEPFFGTGQNPMP